MIRATLHFGETLNEPCRAHIVGAGNEHHDSRPVHAEEALLVYVVLSEIGGRFQPLERLGVFNAFHQDLDFGLKLNVFLDSQCHGTSDGLAVKSPP